MHLSYLLLRIALLLAPLAFISTTWLYLYPIFHGCSFPTPPSTYPHAAAPFRLLSLGDPQLEGDSSLPDPNALVFPSVEFLIPHLRDATTLQQRREIAVQAAKGVARDAGKWLEGKRKAVDLWGNDWYLAHIVRTLRWWTEPTHVSVLGDLLGSQWVTDGEFRKRAGRYWGIVMRGLRNVPDSVFGVREVEDEIDGHGEQSGSEENNELSDAQEAGDATNSKGESPEEGGNERSDAQEELEEPLSSAPDFENVEINESSDAQEEPQEPQETPDHNNEPEEVHNNEKKKRTGWGGTTEVLGDDKDWANRVINIAGNHDVGYAGDIDASRIERFETAFGSVNWDIWFTLPKDLRALPGTESPTDDNPAPQELPALRLVVLNSMNFDTPAWSSDLQAETYAFTNHIITNSRSVTDKTHATILLTHIPLEKEEGICVDSPYFDFFEGGYGVKEQNMLSDHSSKIILEGMFGMSGNKDAFGGGFGRRGIIMNGHDHAGCDVVHFMRQPGVDGGCDVAGIKQEEAYWHPVARNESVPIDAIDDDMTATSSPTSNDTDTTKNSETPENVDIPPTIETPESAAPPKWKARRYPTLQYEINEQNECQVIDRAPHIREITLRSMMGEFSGYAGFLSAWFDYDLGEKGEWVFEFSTCGLGVQHWWWAVHILDFALLVCLLVGGAVRVVEASVDGEVVPQKGGPKVEAANGKVSGSKAVVGKGEVHGEGDGTGRRAGTGVNGRT